MRGFLPLLAAFLPALVAGLQWETFDISSMIHQETDEKIQYLDTNGNAQKLENILKAGGANSFKVRIWVNPSDGRYNLDYALKVGRRARDAGLPMVLNLHYSDTWADPAHQTKPSPWQSLNDDQLINQVRTYTTNVINAFANENIQVNMVGIGNEIRGGMLWPTGRYDNMWNLGRLLTAASQGVRQSRHGGAKVMIHLDRGYSWGDQQWFYDSLQNNGFNMGNVDVLGVSYYPFWDATQSTLENFRTTVTNMANRYGKQVVVAETDWPTQCSKAADNIPASLRNSIPFSPQGQVTWVQRIGDILRSIPNGRGAGIMYWEPGWVSNTVLGSACEDGGVLFEADWSKWPNTIPARARSSVNMFNSVA